MKKLIAVLISLCFTAGTAIAKAPHATTKRHTVHATKSTHVKRAKSGATHKKAGNKTAHKKSVRKHRQA